MWILFFRSAGCLLVLSLFMPASAATTALPYGECRAGYWHSNRNLDDVTDIEKATCFVNWRFALSDQARLNLSGRFGYGDAGTVNRAQERVRDGFLELEPGPWTFRLGRQIIAWGRADRINPTDNLSPRDFTLLVPEDDEQRMGINALLGRYQFGNGVSMTAVAIPEFEAHKVPKGSLPPNLVQASDSRKTEWAWKLDRSGEGFDWSVSYFDGYDRFPRYNIEAMGPASFVVNARYERMRTIGADFSTALSSWTIRGEAAVSEFFSECASCNRDDRKTYRLVLGIDRDFADTANVNMQLFTTRRTDYTDPAALSAARRPIAAGKNRLNSEFAAQETGLTFRISDKYFNERLRLELGSIIDLTNDSGLIRPRLTYAFSDAVKMLAGADYFYGKDDSFFGVRKKNQTAFVELGLVF